jgi:hypothetical protein
MVILGHLIIKEAAMDKRRNIVLASALIAILFSLLVVLSTVAQAAQSGRFHYGVHNLIGASPEEVGRFAQEYIQAQHQVSDNTAQILLSRSVAKADIPTLGLGCPPEFAAMEEPPLMLVILKGKFNNGGFGLGMGVPDYNYASYIFDVWSAIPVDIKMTRDGAIFRTALNDPSLPLPPAEFTAPRACPTSAPKTLHYGDTAPPCHHQIRPHNYCI